VSQSTLWIFLYFPISGFFSATEVTPSSTWCREHHSWGTEESLGELLLSKRDPLKAAHLFKSLFCSFSTVRYSVLVVGPQAERAHPRQLRIRLYKWSNLCSHLTRRLWRIIQRNENATLHTLQSLLQILQVISKKLPLPHFHKVLFKSLLKTSFAFIKIRAGDVLPAFTWMDPRWAGKGLRRSTLAFYLAHTQENF